MWWILHFFHNFNNLRWWTKTCERTIWISKTLDSKESIHNISSRRHLRCLRLEAFQSQSRSKLSLQEKEASLCFRKGKIKIFLSSIPQKDNRFLSSGDCGPHCKIWQIWFYCMAVFYWARIIPQKELGWNFVIAITIIDFNQGTMYQKKL